MASTVASEWRSAYLQQYARDMKRVYIEPSTGFSALVALANTLAAVDIIGSKAEAQEFVESLAAEVEVRYSTLYAGSFEDQLVNAVFTVLPFTYAP